MEPNEFFPQDPYQSSLAESCIKSIEVLQAAVEEHKDTCNCQLDILEEERVHLKDLQSKPKANIKMIERKFE
jgi:hypothetical protein